MEDVIKKIDFDKFARISRELECCQGQDLYLLAHFLPRAQYTVKIPHVSEKGT